MKKKNSSIKGENQHRRNRGTSGPNGNYNNKPLVDKPYTLPKESRTEIKIENSSIKCENQHRS